jgi:hypothetical protein
VERQEPLLPLADSMKDARQIYCGECMRRFPQEDWHVIASVEPPHLGGPEPGNPRKRLTRNEDGSPNLSNLTQTELLLVDGTFSQWEVSIRQHVRNGKRTDVEAEKQWYVDRFPHTDPSQMEKLNSTQLQYQHTTASKDRVAYRLLVPDEKHMVELQCPNCGFHVRVKVRVVERILYEALENGGHIVLGSRGLSIRGGRGIALHSAVP